eukprot:GHVH01002343.1.p1 GENE.GHVH01002343.1~~GHVH01002343.1.p1  ORF type:complete len:434 (-),score=55.74 GHVH01002343.1:1151-2452(-)
MKKVNSNNEGTIWRSICPGPSYNCNTTLRALSSEQISRLKAMIAKSGQRLLHSRPSGKCASQIPSPSFLTIPCVEEPGLSTSVVAMNVATRQEPRWVSLTEGFKTKGLVVLTDWRAVTEGEDRWMGQVNAEFPPMRIILQNLMSNDDIMGFSPELVSTQSGDHRNTVLVHVSEQWPLEAAARRGGFEPGSFENRKWILEISNDLESLIWLDASDRLSAQERIRHALALDQRSVAHTDSILALGDWINGLERPYVLRSGKARLVDGVMEIYPWYHLSAVTQRVHEGADNVETFVLYYDSNDWHSFKARKAWSQVAATLKRSESIAIVQIDVAQQAMDQTGELIAPTLDELQRGGISVDSSLRRPPDVIPSIFQVLSMKVDSTCGSSEPTCASTLMPETRQEWFPYTGEYHQSDAILEWIYMMSINNIIRWTVKV